jgi:hypothetical protein
VIGVDFGLIVPDESKTLQDGAVRPWQTPSFNECQDDVVKYAAKRGIPLDTPWRELSAKHKTWVLEGEPEWVSWKKSWPGTWYGVRRFFKWLETKAYKMHIRVLLSKYRAYTPCQACGGARLKPDPLAWRLGTKQDADRVLPATQRYRANTVCYDDEILRALPGLTVHDLMLLPIDRTKDFIDNLHLPASAGSGSQIYKALNADATNASGVTSPEPGAPASPSDVHLDEATYQSHDSARDLARQHAVRARRAVDRPASARHGTRDRRDAAAARRRQFAGRRRARAADHAQSRPHPRHGSRPRRARRRNRVLRHACGA